MNFLSIVQPDYNSAMLAITLNNCQESREQSFVPKNNILVCALFSEKDIHKPKRNGKYDVARSNSVKYFGQLQ